MSTEQLLGAPSVPQSETSSVPRPPANGYERASLAYQRGDYAAAVRMLQAHLANHPNSLAAHYALGLSASALGDHFAAEAEYRWVVGKQPRHMDAVYRLAVILQETAGANQERLREAETLFERVLPTSRFSDAQQRLQQINLRVRHQQLAPISTDISRTRPAGDALSLYASPDPSQGRALQSPEPSFHVLDAMATTPPSLATDLDNGNPADPGRLLYKTHRAARSYGHSWIVVAALVVAGGIISAQTGYVEVATGVNSGATTQINPNVVAGLPLAAAALVLVSVLMRAYTTKYVFHARRLDITEGILSRSRIIVWYYDLTDISYQRSMLNILMNTAGLELAYDAGGQQPKQAKIPGLATGGKTNRLYEEIQEASLRERRAMKKQFV
jgi:tetratricopeptide (TPR) repeat protein